MLMDEMRAKGLTVQEPKLKMVYCEGRYVNYRIADENEEPTVKYSLHASMNLFKDVLPETSKTS